MKFLPTAGTVRSALWTIAILAVLMRIPQTAKLITGANG